MRILAVGSLLVISMVLSGLSQGQHMLFHLLGAGQPIANFSTASQTVNEADGVWGPWPAGLSAWTRRRSILLDGQAGALTNFPVRIKLDSTRVDYGQTQSAGQDLRFTDSSGAALSYEIENWDEAGTSNVWVKVPTLAAYPAATRIWMYYGNAAASDAQTATAVWDANHSAVWHFAGGATDSTSNAKNGTATGVTYPTGLAGTALGINGTTGNSVQPPNSLLAGNTFSVGAWFKTTGSGVIVGHSNLAYPAGAANWDPLLYVGTDGKLRGGTYAGANPSLASSQTVNDGQWHYAILTGSGSTQSLYLDGALVGSFSGTINMAAMIYNYIGMGHWSGWPSTSGVWNSFNGQIDEVQISTSVRSADWVKASYASGADTMALYGAEETPTSGAAIITVQLNTSATTTITIPYTVSGTSTAGTDHSQVSGNLVINGGSSSGSLNARIYRDDLVEGSETAILTLGAPTGATLGPDTVHTVTITDEVLSPPDAIDDSVNLTSLNAVTIPVLANDTDANGDPLSITSFTSPTSGTLTRSAQQLVYTPSGDFGATDSFTYTISDGRGGSDTATVTLNYQIPFTWIGAGADANWTTAANWLGGVVPGAGDTVYFNSQCTTYCNPQVNSNASVNSFRMNTSFTGTITQGAATISVAGSWLQKAGTFVGSSSNISIGYYLTVDGGTFTSTSGSLSYGVSAVETANVTVLKVASGATFNHNSGTILDRSSRAQYQTLYLTIDVPTDTVFNNITFDDGQCGAWWYFGGGGSSYGANHHRMLNRIRVDGTLTHNCGQLLGDIALYGNLVMGANARGNSWNTGAIQFMGTAAQTYEISVVGGRTHNVTVNKTGGSVSANSTTFAMTSLAIIQGSFTAPTGTLSIGASVVSSGTHNVFTVASGQTFVHNSGTLELYSYLSNCSNTSTINIDVDSTLTLNNVAVSGTRDPCYGGYSNMVLNAADTIIVLGDLTLNGGRLYGNWNVGGNLSVTSTNFGGGTAPLLLNGTAGQSLSQVASSGIPTGTLTMNKASGTTTQTTAISLSTAGQDLTLTSGTYDMAGFALAVNDVLTVGTNAKLLCNGGTLTYASAVINGEVSCGPSAGITWTGLAGDGLWTTAGNWTNNTIPGASDIAYFNGSCTNCNVSINGAVSVKGIVMASTYAGTLTQGSGNAITVGTSGWTIAGGTFAGGDSAVSINGTLAISGGVYTATSATTSIGLTTGPCAVNTPLNMTAGTFNHGNGRMTVYGGRVVGQSCNTTAQLVFPVGFTVYDFEAASTPSAGGWHSFLSATSATTINVARNYYHYGQVINFTADVKGDVYINTNETPETGVIRLSGTTDQYYNYTSGMAPTIRVDKVSGAALPGGGVTNFSAWSLEVLQGSFTAPSGALNLGMTTWSAVSHNALLVSSGTTFSTNGGTIRFNLARDTGASAHTTSTISVPVGFAFNNVEINANTIGSGWYDYITSATTLVVNGDLLFAGKTNNANWNVYGNITVNGNANGGTGTIKVAGSGNQTVTGTSAARFSHLEIASTGGVVTLSGTLYIYRNFTYTSGTVDAGTSTVSFYADTGVTNILTPGVMTFNNVRFDGWASAFTLTGTMDVAGTLSLASITGSPPVSINTGTVLARGPIAFTNYGVTGTGLIKVVGNSNQTVSGTSGVKIPNFEIASTGGTVTYSGTLNFIKSYTHTSGTVDASTSTVQLATGGTSSQTFVPGATVFNNLTLGGYNTVYTMTGTATANGTLTFNSSTGSPASSYNSGAIVANGNVVFSTYGALGNVTLSYEGSTNTTLSLSGSVSKPTGLVTVNKSGGAKITLLSNYALTAAGQDLNVSGGTFDLGGYTLTVPDVVTVGAGATLKCSGGTFSSTLLTNSGTINCPGYSGYDFNWTGAGGNSNWNTAANWAGGVVPTTTDVAAFQDTYCGANCNAVMNVNVDIKGLQILSPYSGTITQASGVTVAVGTTGWTQAAGTFAGGNANVTVAGGMNFSAGTFTSTSAMLQVRNTTTIAGTYNHNNGKLRLGADYNTNRNISLGTLTLRDLEFYSESSYDSYQINLTGTVAVLGDLSFTRFDGGAPGAIYGGTLNVSGNITSNINYYGSMVVRAVGSTSQTISGTTTSAYIPNLVIASTGGTVSVSGTLGIYQSLTYTSGTVSFGTSTVTLAGAYNAAYALNLASLNFYNLTFLSECARDQVTFTITGSLNVGGNLSYVSTCATSSVTGGQINVSGSISTSGSSAYNGTAPVYMIGSSAATMSQSGSGNFAKGNLIINKSGGAVVTQTSNIALSTAGQNLTIQNGTLNMAGYSLNVAGTLTNSSVLQRGTSPSCGTITAGTYSGTAAICP